MNIFHEEYSGIFSWFVEGCLTRQREGLGTPLAVEEAPRAYRGEMDAVGNFIRDRCDVRERAGSERLLAFRLQDLGYVKQRRKDANHWVGIRLSPFAGCS